jgi:hypothetical protein|eukprot:COSAG01_NODE_7464_length_3201_cov_5.933914_2_plen_51_part_00
MQVLKEALELLKPGGRSKFIQAAKLIGDAHSALAQNDGYSGEGSRACSIQ